MSLRNKTIIIVGLTTLSLIAILFATSQGILISGIARLEQKDVQKKVESVLKGINESLAQMDSIAQDYTAWDKTVAFINDEKDDTRQSKSTDTTLAQLDLNFLLLVDNSGSVLYMKSINLADNVDTQLPISFKEYYTISGILISHTEVQGVIKGALALPEGPLLVVSRPIVNNQLQSSIQGTVILGRFLRDNDSTYFAGVEKVSFKNLSLKDTEVPFEALQMSFSPPGSAPGIVPQPIDKDTIAGYTLLSDIEGNPSVVVRVEQDRDLYKQGQANISYFGLALLATGLAYAVVMLFVLENYVLIRLARLGKSVSMIGKSSNIAARVVMPGHDELGELAREINKMLEALHHSENALRQSEERLKLAINGADLLLWDLNLATGEMTFNRDITYTSNWVDNASNPIHLPKNRDELQQMVHPNDWQAIEDAYTHHLSGENPQFEVEHRVRTQSGGYLWVLLTGKIIYSEKGVPLRMVGISQNISHRKGMEDELKRVRESV